MSRIEPDDTSVGILVKLAEGNPGGLTVMINLMKESEAIDPDSVMGEFSHILMLDAFEIYGPRIWMLYKDVCGENLTKTVAVLRAVQLGKLSPTKMNHAIDNRGEGIDIDAVLIDVCTQLPEFGKATL